MCDIYVVLLCAGRFGLGWAHDVFKFARHMLMHFHAYVPSFSYILIYSVLVLFWLFLSLSLHSCVNLLLWHLNANLLYLGHLLPLTLHHPLFGFVMRTLERTSWKTFVNETFIQNVMSFCQTFLTLTYPLSFTVGVGSHFVTSRSLVPPWSYRSFTPICTESILQYLISSLAFEVHAL